MHRGITSSAYADFGHGVIKWIIKAPEVAFKECMSDQGLLWESPQGEGLIGRESTKSSPWRFLSSHPLVGQFAALTEKTSLHDQLTKPSG